MTLVPEVGKYNPVAFS